MSLDNKALQKSLAEFASENTRYPNGATAWITTIPEWPEILEAWQSGQVNQGQILDWLVQIRGYDAEKVTRSKIAHLSKVYPRRHRA